MLKHFLAYFMFAFTMFAAGAPAVGGGGAGDAGGGAGDAGAGGDDGGEGSGDDAGDLGDDGGEGAGDDLGEELGEDGQPKQPERKLDETGDFKGLVSKRILALSKESPKFAEAIKENPKLRDTIEASFRRDMAYRELYPTVAEAREMREQFPNGIADVQQLFSEVEELGQVDVNFTSRDPQGNYSGHTALIQDMFTQDRGAAVALLRTIPKEWARLDSESYNEVMGNIVGATLVRAEIPEWLTELRDAAKEAKQPALAQSLEKMLRWSQGYLKQKSAPSEEERRLEGQREQFRREQGERQQQDFTRFKTSFFQESEKLQQGIIRKHPAMAATLQQKSLSDQKKKEIVTKVQQRIREHLKSSPAFMKKLTPLYNSGKLKESLDLQQAQWSYPWMLNKFVRQVLAEETPGLVRQNRERVRGGQPQTQRQPVKQGQQQGQDKTKRTAPYQEAGVWRKADGTRFTTAEILRGLHLKQA